MLTNARSLGYVFNPLTLFWCHDRDGAIVCVIAEVHNTYGQRHRYLLRPDDAGRAETDEAVLRLAVLPGRRLLPDERARARATRWRHASRCTGPDERPFTASVRGVAPAGHRTAALAHGAAPSVRDLADPRADHGPRHSAVAQGTAGPAAPTTPVRPRYRGAHRAHRCRPTRHPDPRHRRASSCRCDCGPGTAARPARPAARSLVIRSRRALRRLLWAPGELGLARAYVTGDIDVDGDLADGFRRVWRLARSPSGRPASRSGCAAGSAAVGAATRLGALGRAADATGHRGPAARTAAHRVARPGRDRAPLRPVQRLLRAAARRARWPTRRRTSPHAGSVARRRPARQARPHLPQARPAAGHAAARRRLRLGIADPARGRALRRARDRRHAVGAAARLRRQADRRSRARPTGSRCGCRTTASSPDAVRGLRRGQLDRDGRARRRGAVPDVRRRSCSTRSSRPAGCCCSRCRGTPTPHPAAARSSRPTSRRTCTCGRCRRRCAHLEDAGFEIRDVEAMREHYVRTVEHWIDHLRAHRYDEFVALQGEEVARVWRLYLVGGALSLRGGPDGRRPDPRGAADGGRRERACRRPGRGPCGTPRREFVRHRRVRRPTAWCAPSRWWSSWSSRSSCAKIAGKHSVIDTAWGLLFVAIAVVDVRRVSSGHGDDLRRWLLLAAAGCCGDCGWPCTSAGARSASREDPRYEQLLAKAKGNRDLYALRIDLPAAGRAGVRHRVADPGRRFRGRPVRRARLDRRRALAGRGVLRGGRRRADGALAFRPGAPRAR